MGERIDKFFLYVKIIIDRIIDFFFSLYWEKRKKAIPELKKKHAFLADSAVTLARKIKQKELKSEELVQAVIDRIKEVNPIVNAIAAEMFMAALAEAREVDARIAAGLSEEEAKAKPFLGVPFTAKECQAMKGMPNTLGLWSRRNEVADSDSAAVASFRKAGAIPLAATNLPELLIWQETRSAVYGMSKNPHHTGRTPGGSSGAEAALTATFSTPISMCSDIGGSTRMPAFYCGMFGHHPTTGTHSMKGVAFRQQEYDSMFSIGFVSKHVEDLPPLLKVLCEEKAERLKLDRDINIKDIKVYYMESSMDTYVSTIRPDLRDAMKKVIAKLTEVSGTTPKPYYHKAFNYMYRLWAYWMSREPDNYGNWFTNFNGEPNVLFELALKLIGQSKHCFFTILRLIELKYIPLLDSDFAENLTKSAKNDLISKLGDNGVLLMPSAPHVAPYHYSCILRPYNFSYFAMVNALKCPATQVPLGKNSDGLPLGIQVVAAPYNDALCFAVAKYLEKEFGGAVMACDVAK